MKTVLLLLALLFSPGPQAQNFAAVEGVVVRTGTSTPVARARVSIAGMQTLTDENGRFALRNVQPGRYRLSASHNAYIPAQYGQRGRGGAGADLTLTAGQSLKDIVIALTPRGAISGRVYDRYGDPVTNATVQALRYAYQDGQRIFVPADSARTNDLGEYRLFWLTPGPYIISATPQESACADAPCSAGTSIEVVQGLIETKNAVSGAVRLDGRAAVPAANGVETHLPVYFPGTTDAAAASAVDLPPGITYTGVDLMTTEARAVRVTGRVVNGVTGQPLLVAALTLVPRRGTLATGPSQRASVSNRGIFEFRHMAPGSYDLVASIPNGSERLAASLPIEVASADIEGITLVLQPQQSLTGRITIEGLSPDSTAINLSSIRVELRREPFTPELLVLLPAVSADGSFTLSGVTPGNYRLKVSAGGMKSYVKAARYGAIDALNPPFRIDGPGQFDIVMSLNTGSLDLTVTDDLQKPFSDATVVIVPDPPRRQRFDLYYASASDESGRAHFDGLAPGDYRIFAWDDVPADAWQDPNFLRLYEDRGKPVRIGEGSRETLELRTIAR